ncbi:MAG: methyltransferase domain-containing protein [Candidatus Latescibacteria bacterium]|nr:methyltransferase domain-containing protein [Candidatus Latescibacterota bacterium]
MTDRAKMAQVYDEGAQHEWQRLQRSPLRWAEWRLLIELLEEYIEPGATVLDVGAGPGRYAEHFIRQHGCKVGLVDLSEECLGLFRGRMGQQWQRQILFTWKSCATDLNFIPDASFDAVLLMGPMYHLLEAQERAAAVRQAHRVLAPGGVLLATFISPYPVLPRLLTWEPELLGDGDFLKNLLQSGRITDPRMTNMTDHWRCWPDQGRALLEEAGLEIVRLRNLEGVGAFFEGKQEELFSDESRFEAWLDVLRATCERPELLGATVHFACLARKAADGQEMGGAVLLPGPEK